MGHSFHLANVFDPPGSRGNFESTIVRSLEDRELGIRKRTERIYDNRGQIKRCPKHAFPGSLEWTTRVVRYHADLRRPVLDWNDFRDFDDVELRAETKTPVVLSIADLMSSRAIDNQLFAPDLFRVDVIVQDFDLRPDFELMVGLYQRQLLGNFCEMPGFLASIGFYEWNTEFGDRPLDGIDLWDHGNDNLGVLGALHRSLIGPRVRAIFDQIRPYVQNKAGRERIALMAKYELEPLLEVGASIAYYVPERLTVSELLGAWESVDVKPAK